MFDSISFDLQELNYITIIFRMLIAILLGGIIGTERDIKHRAAGVRTHMLVCLGAAIVMMTNEYIYFEYPDANIDITRMGAQVVSGIGFIGAGTILVTRDNRVKGLTTAAGLWTAAAIGLAIGIGYYRIALVGGISIIGIIIFLKPFKDFIIDRATQSEVMLLVHTSNGFHSFMNYASSVDLKIAHIEVEKDLMTDPNKNELIFTVTLEFGEQLQKEDALHRLRVTEGIIDVIEIESS